MILAGDIGGTNTRLAAFDEMGSTFTPKCEEVFKSTDHASLEEMATLFLKKNQFEVVAVCIGFAGPVKKGRAVGTNLPWNISASDLGKCLNVKDVWILNDLEANAYGIETLSPKDFYTINVGEKDEEGNVGLISAGTGLGEAGMVFDGKRLLPFATEGGHTDFAPSDDLQYEFLRFLQKRYNHVSWERVVSGMGLVNIYTFLRDSGRGKDPKALEDEILQEEGGGPSISRAALAGKSDLCDKVLNMFVSFYGAEAGNLALKVLATGGMYLGGGIAPKIIERFKTPLFFQSFVSKGRFEKLLRAVPVRVILNDKTALMGAASYARSNCQALNTCKPVAGRS